MKTEENAVPRWAATVIPLPPNQPSRPYLGGAGIAKLRGTTQQREDASEDFLASTTEIAGGSGVGLTVLPDGSTLRDRVIEDPEGFLGPRHAARLGADPAVLVKLLNTAQRLFVHFHPDNAFAQKHLDCKYGKSEGWIVTDCEAGAGQVYLGFKRAVDLATARDWVSAQKVPAMLAELNEITVRPGESYFVPGGIPHAIGPGVTVVELQEPTDFSVLMEWEGFGIGPDDGHLGLGFELAMQALDISAWDERRLAGLRGVVSGEPGTHSIFPAAADRFFRAQAVNVAGELSLDPEFSVLVVLDGEGELHTEAGAYPLSAGAVLLVPYAVGPQRLAGTLRALRCRTPAL